MHHRLAAGLNAMKRRGYIDEVFRFCVHHQLTVPCIHTSRIETCKNMKQLISGAVGLRVTMVLYLVHDDKDVNCDDVTTIVVMEWMAVHLALESSRGIVCSPTQQRATSFGCLTIYDDN